MWVGLFAAFKVYIQVVVYNFLIVRGVVYVCLSRQLPVTVEALSPPLAVEIIWNNVMARSLNGFFMSHIYESFSINALITKRQIQRCTHQVGKSVFFNDHNSTVDRILVIIQGPVL